MEGNERGRREEGKIVGLRGCEEEKGWKGT